MKSDSHKASDWAALRSEVFDVFTPGPPITETELFAGRQAIIQRLQDVTRERARNAIIYGERGVGKTSLASTFHKGLNFTDPNSGIALRSVVEIHINSDTADSFDSLWRKVFRRIRRKDSDRTADLDYSGPIEPDHVFLELQNFSQNEVPIIIIDEYDRIGSEDCRILMTDTIKALTLSRTNPTIVLVGVAEDIIDLVHDHASISPRNLIQVPMKRMSPSEIKEIIVSRMKKIKMHISDDALWRIAYFSAGLPYYAHSLGKYSALRCIEKQKRSISEEIVLQAIEDCMDDVDYSIVESYTKATEYIYSKKNLFREVLAACALAETNDLGQFTALAIEDPLSAILGEKVKVPSFAFHLNEMCGPDRGSILRKTGERKTYKYHFAEAAMQPYVIMKCLKDNAISKLIYQRFNVTRQRGFSI
jgi:hypothetical protein